jgi:hypothetical protein
MSEQTTEQETAEPDEPASYDRRAVTIADECLSAGVWPVRRLPRDVDDD